MLFHLLSPPRPTPFPFAGFFLLFSFYSAILAFSPSSPFCRIISFLRFLPLAPVPPRAHPCPSFRLYACPLSPCPPHLCSLLFLALVRQSPLRASPPCPSPTMSTSTPFDLHFERNLAQNVGPTTSRNFNHNFQTCCTRNYSPSALQRNDF